MKVRVVGDKLLVEMFRLAGINGSVPDADQTANEIVDRYLEDHEIGVILVGSSCAAEMGEKFREYLQRRKLPVVLRIPDRQDQAGCAEEMRNHLQKSLGIKL